MDEGFEIGDKVATIQGRNLFSYRQSLAKAVFIIYFFARQSGDGPCAYCQQ
jgi:hypothetical protein